MVYEQVGHKGGSFAKKNMVYEQVGHTCKGEPFAKKSQGTSKWDGHKGGPFAKKPRCTSKSDIRGDPLLKKPWCTSKWDIGGGGTYSTAQNLWRKLSAQT